MKMTKEEVSKFIDDGIAKALKPLLEVKRPEGETDDRSNEENAMGARRSPDAARGPRRARRVLVLFRAND